VTLRFRKSECANDKADGGGPFVRSGTGVEKDAAVSSFSLDANPRHKPQLRAADRLDRMIGN
jgi:hypothetical protein